MKRIFFIFIIFFVWATAVSGRTYRYDFGTVSENGGIVAHKFSLSPRKSAVAIVKAFANCPCVKAEYKTATVKAGEPVNVTVTFDPTRQSGHFTKSVFVRLSDSSRDTLMITGTINRQRPRIDTSGYPTDLGRGLRLSTSSVNFGSMKAGEKKTITVSLMNAFEAGMHLDFKVSGKDASYLTIPCGLKLAPLAQSSVPFILTIPKGAKATKKLDIVVTPIVNDSPTDPIPLKVSIK